MKMKRVVVTSCNLRFAPGAEALLRSAQRCHPDIGRLCYVPPQDFEATTALLSGVATVRPFPSMIHGVPMGNLANVGRLFAVATQAEVAAYIDADVVFCRPAPELWDVPAGMVNAVRDASNIVANNLAGENQARLIRQAPNVAMRKGANTGVFALRPSEWPDLVERFQHVLTEGGYEYEYIIDQPILNVVFGSHFNWLPAEFNAHGLFDGTAPRGVRLAHFTGKVKPWMPGFPKHEPAYWYWLRYGTAGTRTARLWAAGLWIAACAPKRWAGRRYRLWVARSERRPV